MVRVRVGKPNSHISQRFTRIRLEPQIPLTTRITLFQVVTYLANNTNKDQYLYLII